MIRVGASSRCLPVPSDLPSRAGDATPVTLLDLVRVISEVTSDDREVVATVMHMLSSGRVRLAGNFRDTPIDDFG